MNGLVEYLTAHCCHGEPCVRVATKRRTTC
jgi:hypothetical protein